jgi:hypothetical protein
VRNAALRDFYVAGWIKHFACIFLANVVCIRVHILNNLPVFKLTYIGVQLESESAKSILRAFFDTITIQECG